MKFYISNNILFYKTIPDYDKVEMMNLEKNLKLTLRKVFSLPEYNF